VTSVLNEFTIARNSSISGLRSEPVNELPKGNEDADVFDVVYICDIEPGPPPPPPQVRGTTYIGGLYVPGAPVSKEAVSLKNS
jgi:hypothetical protein